MAIIDVYNILKDGRQRMVDRYVPAADSRCKYSGSMTATMETGVSLP